MPLKLGKSCFLREIFGKRGMKSLRLWILEKEYTLLESHYNSLRTSNVLFILRAFPLRNIETCTVFLLLSFVCSKDEVNYPRRHSPFTLAIRPSKGCLSYLFATFSFSIRKQRLLHLLFLIFSPGGIIEWQISVIYDIVRCSPLEKADKIFDERWLNLGCNSENKKR